LHRAGLRFRVHSPSLPGKPDLVFRKYQAVLFVHGCFWHRHRRCQYATTPTTRREFWQRKFADNLRRDKIVARKLRADGWRVFVLWECEANVESAERLFFQIVSER
jgi:DNA mismatch endonuclease (patch repair protein)